MNLNALHRRLMQGVLDIGNSLPLVITGVPTTTLRLKQADSVIEI
jgi:hypothetical protein